MRRPRKLAGAVLARLAQPSSLAGISALALLVGRSVADSQAWADGAALVFGVLAVVVNEGRQS